MAVRNFWVDASIDGRKTDLSGGPVSKEGGMTISIKQRSEGGIVTAFRLYCYELDGELTTEVCTASGALVTRFETVR